MASPVVFWRIPQIVVDLDSVLFLGPDGNGKRVYDKAAVQLVGGIGDLGIDTDGLAEEIRETIDAIIRKRERGHGNGEQRG